jgi:hypothetical protein
MAFSFSGRAGQGAHDNLQELLAAQLQEEMLRADQAQQDRSLGQADERIGLDRDSLALNTRQQDFVERERGADIEQESMDKMRGHQAETQKRLDLIQLGQDQDEYIEQQPEGVRRVLGGLTKFGVKPTAESLKDPDEEENRKRAEIEYRAQTEAKYRAKPQGPGRGQRELYRRGGTTVPLYPDELQPGDEYVSRSGGGGRDTVTAGEETREKRAKSAREVVTLLKDLSQGIQTGSGIQQKASGAYRDLAGQYGYDPTAAVYNALKGSAGATLAVHVMGAQNLSDPDRAIWDKMIPATGVDKKTKDALYLYLENYLRDRPAAELLPAEATATPGSARPPNDLIMGVTEVLTTGRVPPAMAGGASGDGAAPAGAPKVGDVVTVRGQNIRVTGIGEGGKLRGVPVP